MFGLGGILGTVGSVVPGGGGGGGGGLALDLSSRAESKAVSEAVSGGTFSSGDIVTSKSGVLLIVAVVILGLILFKGKK